MTAVQPKFAIVVSRFNHVITDKLLEGALSQFATIGIDTKQINITHVPGAFELPLTAKWLANTEKYAAIICLGSVIRGDTDHYNYVCQQVSAGCMNVMLECERPVIFGVLTTENSQQAEDRVGGKSGHIGKEAVKTAMAMLQVAADIAG